MTEPERPETDGTPVPVPVTDTDPRIPLVIEPTGMPPAEEFEDTMPGENPEDPSDAPTDPEHKPKIKTLPVMTLEFARGNTRQRRSRKHRRARRAFVRMFRGPRVELACALFSSGAQP